MNQRIDTERPVSLLLSGGVDSSLALIELCKAGFRNISVYYLKIWLEEEGGGHPSDCPWEEDIRYARAVCDRTGLPLRVVAMQEEYRERIVSYTLSELLAGRTPSPDIFCNVRIKFGAFYDYLKRRPGFSEEGYIASGHYARVDRSVPEVTRLRRGVDPVKDQSYFLSHLTRAQLDRLLLPVGGLKKSGVRERAAKHDLPSRDRPDSQGICFLGKIRYSDFVRSYLGIRCGDIVEKESGKTLGQHNGFWFHTIGQRQGLGLSDGPWYVCGKDLDRNIVYVGRSAPALFADRIEITDGSWFGEEAPPPGRYLCKLRHGPKLTGCRIGEFHTGENGEERCAVLLDEGDRGIAPGQFVILYRDDLCLGGGRVAQVEQSDS